MSKSGGRFRKWLMVSAVVVGLYAIIGFFVLPPIVRSQMQKRGTEALSRQVTVEKVRFNPFTFLFSVDQLKIADQSEGELASWKLVAVNFDPLDSLFRWQFYFSEILVVDPVKHIRIDSDGTLNIADLIEKQTLEADTPEVSVTANDLPSVGVRSVHVEGWKAEFTDESRPTPFQTVIGPMTFSLHDLSTRPDEKSPYEFDGTTDAGGSFKWSGTVSLNPLGTTGSIEFAGFSIQKYAPYGEEFHNAEIRTGTVGFSTDYEVSIGEEMVLRLANTRADIENVALAFAGSDEPEVSMKKFGLEMTKADGVARTAEVARIAVDGVEVAVTRRADGTIDLLDWVKKETTPETGQSAEAPEETDAGPAPTVQVAEISVTDARVRFTDAMLSDPATTVLDQISLTAKNAGTDLDREVDVSMDLRVNESGTVSLSGTVRPLPLAAAVDVVVRNLALAPAEPYLQQHADVRLVAGELQVDGHVDVEMSRDEELKLDWTGDAVVEGVSIAGLEGGDELMALNRLGLNGTKFVLEPLSIEANEIAIDHPKVNVVIDEEGMVNLLTALRIDQTKKDDSDAGEAGAEEKTSEIVGKATRQKLPFDAKIGVISIAEGDFGLDDRSVPGGFTTRLNEFGGTIKGLSSESVARADVDLSAKLDGRSPLQITGAINPLTEDQFSDIKVIFSGIRMPSLSPYTAKYLGQKIEKGTLRVDVDYQVSQNVLNGENKIVLDQFYLGEKVESEDALGLPVGLAVSLLRDREGVIELDVPVSGNLDDPSFKLGGLVMKTIGNILIKAATSPFSLLGNLVGGGGKEVDLSYVDFDSGLADLNDAAAKKLELLGKALFERPALRLEIIAPPSPVTDRAGLVAARFREILGEQKAMSLAGAEGTAAGDVAAAEVAPEEEEALIRTLFARMFPDEVAAMAQATVDESDPEAPAAGPESGKPERKRNFFERLFGIGRDKEKESSGSQTAAESAPVASETSEGVNTTEAQPRITVAEMRNRIMDTLEISEDDIQALSAARAEAIREAILAGGEIDAGRVLVAGSPSVPKEASPSAEGGRVFFGLE